MIARPAPTPTRWALFLLLLAVTILTALGGLTASRAHRRQASGSGTLTYSAGVDYTDTDYVRTLSIPQFPTGQGTLTSVDVSLSGAVKNRCAAENTGPSAEGYSFDAAFHVGLAGPSGAALLNADPSLPVLSGTLPSYDGTMDFGGTSGFTTDRVASANASMTLTSAADLAAFIGGGSVPFSASATTNASVTSPGNGSALILTKERAILTVTYHFTRASTGNPRVPQGGSNSFPVTGSLAPAGGETWDVIDSSSAVVAKASAPLGWTVSLSGTTFTVGAPPAAVIAPNYTVRYGSGTGGGGGGVGSPDAAGRRASRNLAASGSTNPWGGVSGTARAAVGARPNARGGGITPQPSGGGSAVFDVVASSSPPAAPSGLTARAISPTRIDLAWTDNSSNELGFQIERKTGADGDWIPVASVGANVHTYPDTGLIPSTLYTYRVRARNAAGDSAASNEASATTFPYAPPAAPTNLQATATSDTSIRLTWTDNSNNEDGFQVLRVSGSTWSDSAATVVGAVDHDQTTYTDSTAFPLSTYTYKVAAYNVAGSAASNAATATTLAAPPPSTVGTEFWLAVPGSGPSGGSGYYLYLTSATGTSGTVSIPGGTFSQGFTVAANGVATVALPSDVELSLADGVEPKAIHVVAGSPVGAQVLDYKSAASEGFTAIPVSAAGTAFVVSSYPSGSNDPSFPAYSELAVVATQNTTTLTVTPKVATGSRAAGTPYTVALNQGEAYELQAVGSLLDLTGTVVTSDKPVAVVAGNHGATVPNGMPTANPLTESIPPVERLGKDFAFVPFATRQGDVVRVVAAYNGTALTVNGTAVATLSAGGAYEAVVSSASTVSASKPVLVQQLSRGFYADGNSQADPFSVTVPALTQYVASAVFEVPDSSLFSASYVNVVVPASAVGDLRLDGTVVPNSSFSALGSTAYAYARLPVGAGAHALATPGTGAAFAATVYGFAAYDGYAYPAALALPTNGSVYAPPVAPTGLTATALSASEIDLAWSSNAPGLTGFRIERKTGASGTWAMIDSVGPNARSYPNVGLAEATTYVYRVVAVGDLDSGPSNEASATTGASGPPAAPTNLTATATYEDQVDLAWVDNSGNETGFRIERDSGDGSGFVFVKNVPANATRASDTTVVPSSTYSYRVCAYNGVGPSSWSNVATVTTLAAVPSDVDTHLVRIAIDRDCLVDGGNATGTVYLNRRVTSDTTVALSCNNVGAAVPSSVTVPAGQRQATFPLTMIAGNYTRSLLYGRYNGWTQRATVVELPSAALTVGTVKATGGLGGILVSWKRLPAFVLGSYFSGYRIERSTGGGFSVVSAVLGRTNEFLDTGAPAGTACTYRVSLITSNGVVAVSGTSSQTTLASGTSQVQWSGQGTIGSDGTATLPFVPSSGINEYDLYVDGFVANNVTTEDQSTIRMAFLKASELSSGDHAVNIVSEDVTPQCSGAQTLSTSGLVADVSKDTFIYLQDGFYPELRATLPDAGATWTVSARSSDGTLLKTWHGSGPRLSVVVAQGDVPMSEDHSRISLKVSTDLPTPQDLPTLVDSLDLMKLAPKVLALITVIPPVNDDLAVGTKPSEIQYGMANELENIFLQKSFISGFSYKVYTANDRDPTAGLFEQLYINIWLASSVEYLYVQGHGGPKADDGYSVGVNNNLVSTYFKYGRVRYWNLWPDGRVITPYDESMYVINHLVDEDGHPSFGGRPYKFVFLYTCNGAGADYAQPLYGHMTSTPASAYIWGHAFAINTDETESAGGLWCVNGKVDVASGFYPNLTAGISEWGSFAMRFWREFVTGNEQSSIAFYYAAFGAAGLYDGSDRGHVTTNWVGQPKLFRAEPGSGVDPP